MRSAKTDSMNTEIRASLLSSIVGSCFYFIAIAPFVAIMFSLIDSYERKWAAEDKAKIIQAQIDILNSFGPGVYGTEDPLQPEGAPSEETLKARYDVPLEPVYIDFDIHKLENVEENVGCTNTWDGDNWLICA